MPHLRIWVSARSRRQRAPHPDPEPASFVSFPPLPKVNVPAPRLGSPDQACRGGRAPQTQDADLFYTPRIFLQRGRDVRIIKPRRIRLAAPIKPADSAL